MKTQPPPSFDLHSDAAAAGCLSGVVRRLLCASLRNNVARDSSERQGVGSSPGAEWKAMQKKKPPAAPCIVARLMGLDSMPVFPYTPPESVRRSRSTNSVESWPGFLCSERSNAVQVRTSLSFREAPTYLRQENEDFLILSFTPEHKAGRMVANGGKDKANVGDPKERKSGENNAVKKETSRKTRDGENNSQKENVPQRKHDNSKGSVVPSPKEKGHRKSCQITKSKDNVKPTKQKEMPRRSGRANNSTKKKKSSASQVKNEAGCSSQDLSPVSVLDYPFMDGEYSFSFNSPNCSENEDDERKQQSSRKKLSSKFEILNSPSSSFHQEAISREREMSLLDEPSIKKSSNGDQASLDWSQIWQKTCTLTEEDLKNSIWTFYRSEEVGEIAAAVALDMLNLVFEEAVSEISSYAVKSNL